MQVAGFAPLVNEQVLQNSACVSAGGAAHVALAPPSPPATLGFEVLLQLLEAAASENKKKEERARVEKAKVFMGAVH